MNSAGSREWLQEGRGKPPTVAWTFSTDAPLVALQLARETGEVLAADASGGLYLLDRRGHLAHLTRGPTPIRALAWSDTGAGGVILVGDSRLGWFTRQLEFKGWIDLPDSGLTAAIDAHGDYAAVSLADGLNLIYDGPRKPLHKFETARPLVSLEFVVAEPRIVGIADYGLLCCHSFRGELLWQEKLWSNAGGISVSGSGSVILVASFSHGIQRYDGDGGHVGSYQVEGTASRVALSYGPKRIAAATLERHLYWLDSDGGLLWAAHAPDDVARLSIDPLGKGLIVGFQSGRIWRLDW